MTYIWCVVESFQKQENFSGDGKTFLIWGWYLDVVLPLWSFICRLDASWIFDVVILVMLLTVPFLFCRWRNNQSRWEAILQRFRCERSGRALLWIWDAIVVIAGIEADGGLWTNGNVSYGFFLQAVDIDLTYC